MWLLSTSIASEPYALLNATPLTAAAERALKPGDSFKECSNCPEMIVAPASRFEMGSPDGEGEKSEHPQHDVHSQTSPTIS